MLKLITEYGLYQDGEHYVAIEALGGGESRTITFEEPFGCSACTSWIHVDSYDFVEESNEGNNIKGPLFIE